MKVHHPHMSIRVALLSRGAFRFVMQSLAQSLEPISSTFSPSMFSPLHWCPARRLGNTRQVNCPAGSVSPPNEWSQFRCTACCGKVGVCVSQEWMRWRPTQQYKFDYNKRDVGCTGEILSCAVQAQNRTGHFPTGHSAAITGSPQDRSTTCTWKMGENVAMDMKV